MHAIVADGRLAGWEDEVCERLDCDRVIKSARLTGMEREVWRLRCEEGLRAREAVAESGIAKKSEDNAWGRAKRKVREAYGWTGGTSA